MNSSAKQTRHRAIDRVKATLALDEPVSRVRLVSPARATLLEMMGIRTIRDLVTHYPRRYVDLSSVCTIAQAPIGESCTIYGTIYSLKLKKPRPRLSLVEITLVDDSATMIVTMFQQPWLMNKLTPGMEVAIAGKVEFNYGFKRMTNPYLEDIDDSQVAGRILPVHPATEKIGPQLMRKLIEHALETTCGLLDPLPLDLRLRYRLMSRAQALRSIHFPRSIQDRMQAHRRLAYEELLMLELFLIQESRRRTQGREPVLHTIDGPHLAALRDLIPFELTDEQEKAVDEILLVLAKPQVANHMLLGDVGTGKTVVAAHALAAAKDSSGQAMLMAPTEVLATQHETTLGPLLAQAGVTSALLTASTSSSEKADILEAFAQGSLDVLIGTHALIEDNVKAHNLTLAVIDEQQRFGVNQRSALLEKGAAVDALYLTATPIPRTLALALYGNLTLSYLVKKPNIHATRTTVVLPKSLQCDAYEAARKALERHEQVYVVCPLIGVDAQTRDEKSASRKRADDEEDQYPRIAIDCDEDYESDNLRAATKEAAFLQEKVFPQYKVALLHGAMNAAEKRDIMEQFRAGTIDVLVSTTVIEVGVDVPNATVMMIQDADRFGLSQLHQLRGRVGRGTLDAEVFLISGSQRQEALDRLQALATTDDGFALAQIDLEMRREGDILGNRQSGVSALKLVNVVRDGAIIEAAAQDARVILDADPDLNEPDHEALRREIALLFDSRGAAQRRG